MAARTDGAGRNERGAYMAAFAGDVDMRSVKHEPGAEMVEGFLCHRRRLRQQKTERYKLQHRQQPEILAAEPHCSDLTTPKSWLLWQRPQSRPNSPLCTSSSLWQVSQLSPLFDIEVSDVL